MRQLKLITLCVFFFGFCTNINAQFWKKLQKKVQDKIEKRVEDKVDKETDKAIDDVLNGKKREEEIQNNESTEVPRFTGGLGILKLYDFGYEYVTEDITISVYGKFDENNLSKSVKSYNSDKLIAPVDAYPKGYALAFNKGGFLNPKAGQITIHHADAKKVVFSLNGTWNGSGGNQPISGSFVSLEITNILDKKKKETLSEEKKKISNTNNNTISSNENLNINTTKPTVEIPSTFNFNKSIELTFTDDKGEQLPMELLVGSYPDIWGMSMTPKDNETKETMIMVMTPKTSTAFIDMGVMKMKKSSSIEQIGSQYNLANQMPENMEQDYKKTGKTKSILGYTCHEYRFDYSLENENASASFWVSKDFPIQNKELPMLGMKMNNPYFNGFVLEFATTQKGQSYTIKVTKISDKNLVINTSEYKNMGF